MVSTKPSSVPQQIPFGYRREPDGRIVIDEDEVETVRALFIGIFDRGVRKLAAEYGLSSALVHKILTEPAYWTGMLRRGGQPTFKVPPIIKPPPKWARRKPDISERGRYRYGNCVGRPYRKGSNQWG